MREILFRGKTTRDPEWIYGDLLHDGYDYDVAIWEEKTKLVTEIQPQTVGQFTGVTDKNGKKIFEGDILRIAKTADDFGGYYYPPLEYPVNVVVRWDFCAWMWETLCEDKRYISFPDAWCKFECEVIGNIHDNPELLGGADNEE